MWRGKYPAYLCRIFQLPYLTFKLSFEWSHEAERGYNDRDDRKLNVGDRANLFFFSLALLVVPTIDEMPVSPTSRRDDENDVVRWQKRVSELVNFFSCTARVVLPAKGRCPLRRK